MGRPYKCPCGSSNNTRKGVRKTKTMGTLILWARGGDAYHIAQALPFLGGQRPLLYDLGALALVLIAVAGVARMLSHRRDQEEDSTSAGGSEPDEQTDDADGEPSDGPTTQDRAEPGEEDSDDDQQ
jgi:hypothetical protein